MAEVRFVVTGDLHYRGANPRARKDNFAETLRRKFLEVTYIARERGAKAIIVPGDLTDTPGLNYATMTELINLLNRSPVTIVAVPGNHDEWGGNPETLARTPYGLLRRIGTIHCLTDSPYPFVRPVELMATLDGRHVFPGETLKPEERWEFYTITGSPYDALTDTPDGLKQYCPGFPHDGRIHVHVAHGMLLEKEPGFALRHTLLSAVENNPDAPDVLICGHEHIGFGVKWVGKTLCINPGALGRLTASVAEMERTVQVALLTLEEGKAPKAELIPLRSAAPGAEVLDRTRIEEVRERSEQLVRFLNLLKAEGETKFLDLREIVEGIAERKALPKEVVNEALRRLGKAREIVGTAAR